MRLIFLRHLVLGGLLFEILAVYQIRIPRGDFILIGIYYMRLEVILYNITTVDRDLRRLAKLRRSHP